MENDFIYRIEKTVKKPYIDVKAKVIDKDYRGEVKVILHNLYTQQIKIFKRMRIAQLILEKNKKIKSLKSKRN